MSTNLHRGPLTDLLLAHTTTALSGYGSGIPVGDGIVPAGAGWIGEPNDPTSHFQPYVVVLPGPANNSSGPVGVSQADWKLAYLLASYSVSRQAVEWQADRARDVWADLAKSQIDLQGQAYGVQQVRVESIGQVTRNDTTDPPYWEQIDGLTIWITKELS